MDRNTIIGFSLIFLILVGYYYWTSPNEAEKARMQKTQDSIALVQQKKNIEEKEASKSDSVIAATDTKTDSVKVAAGIGGFAAHVKGVDSIIVLKNKSISVMVSAKGGRIYNVRLNEYQRSDSTPLNLYEANKSNFYYEINTVNGVLKTDDLYWQVAAHTDSSLTMRLDNGAGSYIDQVYKLNKQDFLMDYQMHLHNMQKVAQQHGNPDIKLTWQATLPKQEKELKWETQNSYITYKQPDENPSNLSSSSPEKEELKYKVQWISFKQQYFNSGIIGKDVFEKGAKVEWTETREKNMVKNMRAEIFLGYGMEEKKDYNMKFYFGPNHFKTLKELNVGIEDHGLQRIVPLGWGIFGWVNRFIVIPVFNLLGSVIGNMGVIILLLTFIIKLLLLPLVYKSYISTAKMRILKPELEQIKEKHNGDLQKMQAENMALYRKAGVSPISGCIPLILQMPILFAMFQFFPNAFELRQKAFLWSNDLSQYDSILNLGFNIPFYGDHVSLFTLLMTVSTLIYTRLNNQISGVTGQMKWIGYFMPVIFLGVLNDYASGLTWYYFVSNMVTFGQQAIIRYSVDDAKLHAQIAEARKKPVKKSGFQSRLEQAMKQQQAKKGGLPAGKKPNTPNKPNPPKKKK